MFLTGSVSAICGCVGVRCRSAEGHVYVIEAGAVGSGSVLVTGASSLHDRVSCLRGALLGKRHVSPGLCRRCSMGHKLHSSAKQKILAKLARMSSIYNFSIVGKHGVPTRNKLCCRKVGMGSLMGNLRNGQFKFRRAAFLLLFKHLPGRSRLRRFLGILFRLRSLAKHFIHSIIVGTSDPGVVGSLRHYILALCACSRGPRSVSMRGTLHRSLRLVTGLPLVTMCSCRTCERFHGSRALLVHGPRGNHSLTRGVLCVLHPSKRCARLRTGMLSITLVLRTRRNNNGGSAFAARIIASSKASACSTVTTSVNSLGKPHRNNTGLGTRKVFSGVGGSIGS